MEVNCVHLKTYGMPKNKSGFIIATYEGDKVDWGFLVFGCLNEIVLHPILRGKS